MALAHIIWNTQRAWECKKMVVGLEVTGDQARHHGATQTAPEHGRLTYGYPPSHRGAHPGK